MARRKTREKWQDELAGFASNVTRYSEIPNVTLPRISLQFVDVPGVEPFQFPGATVKFEIDATPST